MLLTLGCKLSGKISNLDRMRDKDKEQDKECRDKDLDFVLF